LEVSIYLCEATTSEEKKALESIKLREQALASIKLQEQALASIQASRTTSLGINQASRTSLSIDPRFEKKQSFSIKLLVQQLQLDPC
jgi:type IV secretory pathway VirB10-like protein